MKAVAMLRIITVLMAMISAFAADGGSWVIPTGVQDPENKWSNEVMAYDGSTGTYAVDNCNREGDGPWIVLLYGNGIRTDRVQINSDFGYNIVDSVSVEVRVGGIWTPVYTGVIPNAVAGTISFPACSLDAVRFRYHYMVKGFLFWLYEFRAFSLPVTSQLPQVVTLSPTSIMPDTAVMHGTVTSDGGEPCSTRFVYRVANGSDLLSTTWSNSSYASGQQASVVLGRITPLQSGTSYSARIQAQNSAGVASGDEVTFTPVPISSTPGQWVSATGVSSETAGGMTWTELDAAMDDDLMTAARCFHGMGAQQWSPNIVLALPNIAIDQIRVQAGITAMNDAVAVEVKAATGEWTTAYQGPIPDSTYQVIPLATPGVYAQVRMRFHFNWDQVGTFWELADFGARVADPSAGNGSSGTALGRATAMSVYPSAVLSANEKDAQIRELEQDFLAIALPTIPWNCHNIKHELGTGTGGVFRPMLPGLPTWVQWNRHTWLQQPVSPRIPLRWPFTTTYTTDYPRVYFSGFGSVVKENVGSTPQGKMVGVEICLSRPLDSDVTVSIVSGGSALQQGRVKPIPTSIVFPRGSTKALLRIEVVDDAVVNGPAKVRMLLMGGRWTPTTGTYELGISPEVLRNSFNLGIIDDEVPPGTDPKLSFELADSETAESGAPITIRARLSSPALQDVRAAISLSGTAKSDFVGGTAVVDADAHVAVIQVPAASGTSIPLIPVGGTEATFTITTVPDTIRMGDKTLVVTMGSAVGATLAAPTTHTLTIHDDQSQVEETTNIPLLSPLTGPTAAFGRGFDSDGNGYTSPPTRIDNLTFNYIHTSVEIPEATWAGDAVGIPVLLLRPELNERLSWRRIHRYRDVGERSSFGPGVFQKYDISCQVSLVGAVTWIRVFDPSYEQSIALCDGGNDDTVKDGIFTGHAAGDLAPVFREIRLTATADGSNDDAVQNPIDARGVKLTAQDGSVIRFHLCRALYADGHQVSRTDLPTSAKFAAASLLSIDARLVSMRTEQGRPLRVSYDETLTEAQLAIDPSRVFQIARVEDQEGRRLDVTYHSQQYAGRWVVASVRLNGTSETQITYGYDAASGFLNSVTYPDAAASTFAWTWDQTHTMASMEMLDIMASDGMVRRNIKLGTLFTGGNGAATNPIYNNSSMLVRAIIAADGHVKYANMFDATTADHWLVFQSGAELKAIYPTAVAWYDDNWTVAKGKVGAPAIKGNIKAAKVSNDLGDWVNYSSSTPAAHVTNIGKRIEMLYDKSQPMSPRVAEVKTPDGLIQKYEVNQDTRRIVRYQGGANEVIRYTYDPKGRMIRLESGLYFNPTTLQDEPTPSYAQWQWSYEALVRGQEFMSSFTDNQNRVSWYTYEDSGRVKSVTYKSPGLQGAEKSQSFTYDALGRLATSVDVHGSITAYEYDQRHRLIARHYEDSTDDRITYYGKESANPDKQQMVEYRSGHRLENGYDDNGRLISRNFYVLSDNKTEVLQDSQSWQYWAGTSLISKRVGMRGDIEEFDYDRSGYSGTECLRPKTAFRRESNDDAGQIVTYIYGSRKTGNDAFLSCLIYPNGRRMFWNYDVNGYLSRQVEEVTPRILPVPGVTSLGVPWEFSLVSPYLDGLSRTTTRVQDALITDESWSAGRPRQLTGDRGLQAFRDQTPIAPILVENEPDIQVDLPAWLIPASGRFSGIAARWPFEGSLMAAAGDVYGISVGGIEEYVPGRVGKALHVVPGRPVDLGRVVLNRSGFTISAWLRPDPVNDTMATIGVPQTLLDASLTHSYRDGFRIQVDGPQIVFETTGRGESARALSMPILNTDDWTHIAISVDRSAGKVRFYQNGVDNTLCDAAIPQFPIASSLRLGEERDGCRPFMGSVDDLRIDNQCMRDDEIAQLSSQAAEREVANIFQGRLAHWRFDADPLLLDATSILVKDASGFGRDLSVVPTTATLPRSVMGALGTALPCATSQRLTAIDAGRWLNFRTAATFSVWLKGDIHQNSAIISSQRNGQIRQLLACNGNGTITATLPFETALPFEVALLTLTSPVLTLSTDAWHHIIVRFDGNGGELLVDGVSCAERALPQGSRRLRGIGDLIIGNSGARAGWQGWLDDVRIFDRRVADADVKGLGETDSVSLGRTQIGGVLTTRTAHLDSLRVETIEYRKRYRHQMTGPMPLWRINDFHTQTRLLTGPLAVNGKAERSVGPPSNNYGTTNHVAVSQYPRFTFKIPVPVVGERVLSASITLNCVVAKNDAKADPSKMIFLIDLSTGKRASQMASLTGLPNGYDYMQGEGWMGYLNPIVYTYRDRVAVPPAFGSDTVSFNSANQIAVANTVPITFDATVLADLAARREVIFESHVTKSVTFGVGKTIADPDVGSVMIPGLTVIAQGALAPKLNVVYALVKSDQDLDGLSDELENALTADLTDRGLDVVFGTFDPNNDHSGIAGDTRLDLDRYLELAGNGVFKTWIDSDGDGLTDREELALFADLGVGANPNENSSNHATVDGSHGTLNDGLQVTLGDNPGQPPVLVVPLPPVVVSAVPTTSQVLLTWSYVPSVVGADPDVSSLVSQRIINADTGAVIENVAPSSRWYAVKNLDPQASYVFKVVGVGRQGDEVSAVTERLRLAPGVFGLFEASGFMATSEPRAVHLQWCYDRSLTDQNAIGFLIHRSEAGSLDTALIAALPMDLSGATRRIYTYSDHDPTLRPATNYVYTLQVVSETDRRSKGQVLRVATPVEDAPHAGLAWREAIFTTDGVLVDYASTNHWTGGGLGSTYAAMYKDAPQPTGWNAIQDPDGSMVLRVPAMPTEAQTWQTIIPENARFCAKFRMRLSGTSPFQDPGTVVFQYLNTTGSADDVPGSVGQMVLYPDRVLLGNMTATFYHGGLPHTYTVVRDGDALRLTVDGYEIPLRPQTGIITSVGSQEGAVRPFLRFGAKSSHSGTTTEWWSFVAAVGATEVFSAGVPAGYQVVPTPTGLVADVSVGGQATLRWDAGPALTTTYRLVVDESPSLTALVNGTSQTLTCTVPGVYHARIQGIDMFGRLSAPSGQIEFNVVARQEATVKTAYLSSIGSSEPGWMWTPALPGSVGSGAWRNLINCMGKLEHSSPLDLWSCEITFALPVTTNDGTGHPEVGSATLVSIYPLTGDPVVCSISADMFHLSGAESAQVRPGGSQHVLRLTNARLVDGFGVVSGVLEARLDGHVIATSDRPIQAKTILLHANAQRAPDASALWVSRAIAVLGSTGSNLMQTNALVPAPVVPEVTIDAMASTINATTGGLSVAWSNPAEVVTAVDVTSVGRSPGLEPLRIIPVRRLDNEGTFVPVTAISMQGSGDPMPIVVKVTPRAVNGASGQGSARSYLESSWRSNGSVTPITLDQLGAPWSLSVRNSSGFFESKPQFEQPSFRVPAVSVRIGTQPIPAQAVPESRCFTRTVGASWVFSAYFDVDSGFSGTIVRAGDAQAGVEVVFHNNELSLVALGGLALQRTPGSREDNGQLPIVAGRTHRLRLECIPAQGVGSTSIVRMLVDDDPGTYFEAVLPAQFASSATLAFGQVAFTQMEPVTTERAATPITWRGISSTVGGGVSETGMVSGPVAGWSYEQGGSLAGAPEAVSDIAAGIIHLGKDTRLAYDAPLAVNLWSLQFQATGHGSGNTCTVVGSDDLTRLPILDGAHVYRVVRTPKGATLFIDRVRQVQEENLPVISTNTGGLPTSIVWETSDESSVDIVGVPRLIAGAIDAVDPELQGICESLLSETFAVPDAQGQGVADVHRHGYLFAHGVLSAGQSLNWHFDTRKDADLDNPQAVNVALGDQITHVYNQGGVYGVNAFQPGVPPVRLGSTKIYPTEPVASIFDVAPPLGLTVTSAVESITVGWIPGGPVDDVLVRLTDPILGAVAFNGTETVQAVAGTQVIINIPSANRGRDLTLSLTARRTVDGVTKYATPFTAQVSSIDAHSIDLQLGSLPMVATEAGDRSASIRIAAHQVDTAGYILWVNQPGHEQGAESTPVRVLARLDRDTVAWLTALKQRDVSRVSSDQGRQIRSLMPSSLLPFVRSGTSPIIFYHPSQSGAPITIPGVANATDVTHPVLVTLDPWDDGRPANADSIPTPNLGSQENGQGVLPTSDPENPVNTRTVQVQTANRSPQITTAPLTLTTVGGPRDQVRVQTIRQILQQHAVPWIVNNVDDSPYLLSATTRGDAFRLTGPVVADRSLTGVTVTLHGDASIANFQRAHVLGSEDNPDAATLPFVYADDLRSLTLPIDVAIVSADLLRGQNPMGISALDADGATTTAALGTILVDDQPPVVTVITPQPGAVVGRPLTITGSYAEESGIAELQVRVNESPNPILMSAKMASVKNGMFAVQIGAGDLPAGTATVQIVMVDLAGNASMPIDLPLVVSEGDVRCRAVLNPVGASLVADIDIIGVGTQADQANLESLIWQGEVIPPDQWTRVDVDGSPRVQVHGRAVGELRTTIANGEAVVSFPRGNGERISRRFTFGASYIGGEAPPSLISVTPDPLLPIAPDAQGRLVLRGVVFRYIDARPGVDPAKVRIQIPDGIGLRDVTDYFNASSTYARQKASTPTVDQTLYLPQEDPRILLHLEDRDGHHVDVVITFLPMDATDQLKPVILATTPIILARGLSQEVYLYGRNLGDLQEIALETTGLSPSAVGMTILDRMSGVTIPGSTVRADRIHVRVVPPTATGVGASSPRIGMQPFPAAGVLVADLDTLADRDRYLAAVTDTNHDGRKTVADLGSPPQLPVILGGLIQPPGVNRDALDPMNDARLALDPGGTGPVVVSSPRPHNGSRTVSDGQLVMSGLIQADTQSVEVSIQSASGAITYGREIVGLAPSTLYAGNSNNPLEFITRSLNLASVPADVQDIVIHIVVSLPNRLNDADVQVSDVPMRVDRTPPAVNFAFLDDTLSQPSILGYLSLYQQLTVGSTSYVQPNYTLQGSITDDQPLDVASVELRLDNRTVDRSLFDIVAKDDGRRIEFTILPEERLNISERWQDSGARHSGLLQLIQLVYGVHRLDVLVRDASGKVGTSARTFLFLPGERVAVQTHCETSFTEGLSQFEGALRNRHPLDNPDAQSGMYQVQTLSNAKIASDVFGADGMPSPNQSDFVNLTKGGHCDGVASPDPADGPVSMVVVPHSLAPEGWPEVAYEGGAMEQMWLVGDDHPSYMAQANAPHGSVSTVVDGNGLRTTTTTSLVCAFPIGTVDIGNLMNAGCDAFRTVIPNGLGGVPSETMSLHNVVSTETTVSEVPIPGTGSTGDYDTGNNGTGGGLAGLGSGFGGSGSSSGGDSGSTGTGGTVDPPTNTGNPTILTLSPTPLCAIRGKPVSVTLQVGDTAEPDGDSRYKSSPGNELAVTGRFPAVESDTSIFTPRIPAIVGAVSWIIPDNSDNYFYPLKWVKNFELHVNGFACGADRTHLRRWNTDEAEHYFIVSSDPRPMFDIDERVVAVVVDASGSSTKSTLTVDVLVADPLVRLSAHPEHLPVTVDIGSRSASASIVATSGITAGAPITLVAHFIGLPIAVGANHFPVRVTNSMGQSSTGHLRIEIGDRDGRVDTVDDWYVAKALTDDDFTQLDMPDGPYPLAIFGEFQGDTGVIDIAKGVAHLPEPSPNSGTPQPPVQVIDLATSAKVHFEKAGRFGRFQRNLVVMSERPPEGALVLPTGSSTDNTAARTAKKQMLDALPLAFGLPSEALELSFGPGAEKQNAKIYIEGISFAQYGNPTSRVAYQALEDAVGDDGAVTIAAYCRSNREIPDAAFVISVQSASGEPVRLIDGQDTTELKIPTMGSVLAFNGYGFHVDSAPIHLVERTESGSRYEYRNSQHRLRVEAGERLVARIDAPIKTSAEMDPSPVGTVHFRGRALIIQPLPAVVYEAPTGVTPEIGRQLPIPWFDIDLGVTLHDRRVRLTQTLASIPGRRLPLNLDLTYRSGETRGSLLGTGWALSWESTFSHAALTKEERETRTPEQSNLIRRGPDGRQDIFVWQSGNVWKVPPGFAAQVKVNLLAPGGPTIVMTDSEGTSETYLMAGNDGQYHLVETKDRFGNTITIVREDGMTSEIVDDRGWHYAVVNKVPENCTGKRLEKIIDPRGVEYRFAYTDPGQLKSVSLRKTNTDTEIQKVTYRYATTGEHELTDVVLPGSEAAYAVVNYAGNENRGAVLKLDYGLNVNGVVAESVSGTGPVRHINTDGVTTDYTFSSAAGCSMLCTRSVTDPAMTQLTMDYEYNDQAREKKVIGPLGTTETIWTELSTPDDQRGSDRMKNRVLKPADGATATIAGIENSVASNTETWTWKPADEFCQIETHKDATATVATTYKYTTKTINNEVFTLTTITRPEQGGIATTIERYTPSGQLDRIVSPAGALTDYRYYKLGNEVNSAKRQDLFGWLRQTIQTTSTATFPPSASQEQIETILLARLDREIPDPLPEVLPPELSDLLVTTTVPDIWGRVMTVQSPNKADSITVYDENLGYVKEVQEPAVVGKGDQGEADDNSPTRNTTTTQNFNGRGFPRFVDRNTVVLSPAAPALTRSGGKLAKRPYQHRTLRTDTTRDDLDRPLTVLQSVQGDNATQVYTYDTGKERVKTVKGFNGAFTIFNYDSAGRRDRTLIGANLVTDIAPTTIDSRLERLVFDVAGNVTDRYITYGGPSAEVHEEHNLYDGFGRQIESQQLVTGHVTRRVHDAQGRVAAEEVVDGYEAPISRTKYTYDGPSGMLATTEDLLKGTIIDHKAVASTLTQEQTIRGLNQVTRTRADGAGRVIEQFMGVGASGLASAMEYDADGNLVRSGTGSSYADALARISLSPWRQFNVAGQVVREARPELGAASIRDYAPGGFGPPSGTVDEVGNSVVTRPDEAGQVSSVRENGFDGKQALTRTATDRPNRKQVQVRYGMTGTGPTKSPDQAVVTTLDKMGRPITEQKYSASDVRSLAPELGDLSAQNLIDAVTAGNPGTLQSETSYDGLGRVLQEKLADGTLREYIYYPDDAGTNQNDTATKNDRRQLHQVFVTPPSVPRWLMRELSSYDRFGKPQVMQEQQWSKGWVQLSQIRGASDGTTASPNHGELVSESIRIVNMLDQEISPAKAVTWQYDVTGKRTQMTLPSGAVVTYAYQDQAWPKTATMTGTAIGTKVLWDIDQRNAFRQTTKEKRWGGAVVQDYDRSGLEYSGLVRSVKLATGDFVSSASYDKRGLKLNEGIWPSTEQSWARYYGYDGLGRLSLTIPLGGQELFGNDDFSLDSSACRSKDTTVDGTKVEYLVGPFGRYQSATVPTGDESLKLRGSIPSEIPFPPSIVVNKRVTFDWDSRGNLTSDSFFSTYNYDPYNRCAHVETGILGYSVTYFYDSLGRRVYRIEKRPDPDSEIHYRLHYDGDLLVEEYRQDITGGATVETQAARTSYNPDGQPVAHETWAPVTNAYAAYVIIGDDRGSVAGVADATGATVLEKLVYSSTGLARRIGTPTQRGSNLVPFGWQGMHREPITGRLNSGGSDYDPLHGRRVNEDPGFVVSSTASMRIGGALQAAGGIALAVTGWETGVGLYVGADQAIAGLRTAISGEGAQTLTQQAFIKAGMSESAAGWADMAVGLGAGLATAPGRMALAATGRGIAAGGRAAWQGGTAALGRGWSAVRPTLNPMNYRLQPGLFVIGGPPPLKYIGPRSLVRDSIEYLHDIQAQTGLRVSSAQRGLLADELRKRSFSKLSAADSEAHRLSFDAVKDDLIEEWERNTGQIWPRYTADVISPKSGLPYRRAGNPYDAHHVIESSYGGPNEWWNIHPAATPGQHQGGIHRAGSIARRLFGG